MAMETKKNHTEKLVRAQKRVDAIKKFHRHLKVYLVINLLLLFANYRAFDFLTDKGVNDTGFFDWFQWHVVSTPALWGIGLLVHAVYVFRFGARPLKELKPRFLKDWEARQIQKYIDKEKSDPEKYE
ncbi:2TM domain-containing protein [Maribacter algicola]|uniref:2TM domain-containing protein n=1 Tax=Meishania litoralis TaxID=3434685 RepID=A0ACC7LM51_9FLAO